MKLRCLALLLALTAHLPLAVADPVVLRMATPGPDGSVWAHQIRAASRAIEEDTKGQVRIKTYFGAIAGDELEMGERIAREQLDGAFSGGVLCMKLAPTTRVMRILGLFQNRAELSYVFGKLQSRIDDEFRRAGFVNLGLLEVGPDMLFTRKPVHSFDELMHTRVWIWSADDTERAGLAAMGVPFIADTTARAGQLYREGQVDGFIATPLAALAFQWSAQARHLVATPLAILDGCIVMANRSFDPLPLAQQRIIRNDLARALVELRERTKRQDDELVSKLFVHQGITLQPTEPLRAQFLRAAKQARDRLPESLVSAPLLLRVMGMLADYRADTAVLSHDR